MTKPHRDRSPSDPLAAGLTLHNDADAGSLGKGGETLPRPPLSCRRQGLSQTADYDCWPDGRSYEMRAERLRLRVESRLPLRVRLTACSKAATHGARVCMVGP